MIRANLLKWSQKDEIIETFEFLWTKLALLDYQKINSFELLTIKTISEAFLDVFNNKIDLTKFTGFLNLKKLF